MQWYKLKHSGLLILSLAISGCGEPPQIAPKEVIRPVKTFLIDAPASSGIRKFPAKIDAGRKAELAFRVPGKVQELLVKEGEQVVEEQVVAKLDPTDFQIVVNDRKATYQKTKKNYDRAKELVGKGHISKMDYDRLEAEFKNAQSGLETAQQDLNYTQLEAPFDGIIARRYIENFQEVQAKQTILDLQDITQLEVKFHVPENLLRRLRASRRYQDDGRKRVPVFASFTDLPDQTYPLTFREASTKADEQTQTFQLTYTMDQLKNATILPGMTASVTVDLSRFVDSGTILLVPVSAIVGDYKLDPAAWVVDEQSMTVKPQPVKVGRMLGARIEILDGLEPGNRIVTAGTPFLKEGMKVRFMPKNEQAEPRPDDLQYQ
ncbi:MAG: efflux RND transporter periplasmic adaptor subunit [Pseudomonadota bacterium]